MTIGTAPAHDTTGALRAIETDIAAGRLDAARGALQRVIASAPGDPRVMLSAALLAHREGNMQGELGALSQAVRVAPQWWPGWGELAKALSRHGRFAESLAAAQRLAEIAPQEIAALEIAVGIANAAGDAPHARQYLEAALALQPQNLAIRRALGVALDKLHAYVEAEQIWRGIVDELPEDVSALGWLGISLLALGRKDEARAVLERAAVLDPEHQSLAFHLALARGETPPTQPLGTVQQLFDDYANRFDQHLELGLQYTLPQRVAEMIRARHPALDISVLDLGCGTGLLGARLGKIKGAFVGVDLSRKMLEKAQQLNVYSRLRMNDLLAELGEISPDSFDCVTANDVLIYVGDLSRVMPAVFRVLRAGGQFIFSCESAADSEGPLVLRPTKRYAHARSAVEKLCRESGFATFQSQPLTLRKDGENGAIEGFVAVAQK